MIIPRYPDPRLKALRAPLPLPAPPRPVRPVQARPAPAAVTAMRRACGFCARVRKALRLGP